MYTISRTATLESQVVTYSHEQIEAAKLLPQLRYAIYRADGKTLSAMARSLECEVSAKAVWATLQQESAEKVLEFGNAV
jgi:hypothetical protein